MTPTALLHRSKLALSSRRYFSSQTSSLPTLNIPGGSSVFGYGNTSRGSRAHPLLKLKPDQAWKIKANERWAVIGGGKDRKILLDLLLSHHRISPSIPSPGRHPFLYSSSSSETPSTTSLTPAPIPIHHLTFALPPSPSGEFSDYTARYGALYESDRLTLMQTIKWLLDPDPLHGGKKGEEEARWATRKVGIEHLLETPFVGLSNGQTRRARLALALLKRPRLMIVEEPFAGLDPEGRTEVSQVLHELNDGGLTRVVLVLRSGEELPAWVTNVVEVQPALTATSDETPGGPVLRFGSNGDEKRWWADKLRADTAGDVDASSSAAPESTTEGAGKEVVRMEGVDVVYGEKKVLSSISWLIRTGDRWHLQGHNGSGKTTLLSLLLGDHPRSFSLPPTSLSLFSHPRRSIATTSLNARIGHTSPEIFKAFPRSTGLTVEEAIGSGFDGIFSRRNLSEEQRGEVAGLVTWFFAQEGGERWAKKEKFSEQPPAVQSLVLFARAMAGTAPLRSFDEMTPRKEMLVLDEPFAFQETEQMERCRRYLRTLGGRVAVVWVGHVEGERPWGEEEGKFLKLVAGQVVDRSE